MPIKKTHLLHDEPSENDEFGTHTRIATLVRDEIVGSKEGRSIAVIGEWGSGKSTVIKLLEAQLKPSIELKEKNIDARTFTYDAWSHHRAHIALHAEHPHFLAYAALRTVALLSNAGHCRNSIVLQSHFHSRVTRTIFRPSWPSHDVAQAVGGQRGDNAMKHVAIGLGLGLAIGLLTVTSANAAGWGSVHKYVKRTGNCAGQEILASYYHSGRRTATGERFDANGNTAAARTWPLGTSLTVTNPHNGRSLSVRINDTGPWGIAYRKGARLDLARGAARRLGMRASQYVCVA